jgi:hypothetical protein
MTDPRTTQGPGTSPDGAGVRAPAAPRRGPLMAYLWAVIVFLVLGVAQIFFAGLGVFSLDGKQVGSPGETAFDPHRFTGNAMGIVAIVILVLALVARAGRPSIILSVVLVALMILQSVLADFGKDVAALGGLHALVGVGLLGVAGRMLALARAAVRAGGSAG